MANALGAEGNIRGRFRVWERLQAYFIGNMKHCALSVLQWSSFMQPITNCSVISPRRDCPMQIFKNFYTFENLQNISWYGNSNQSPCELIFYVFLISHLQLESVYHPSVFFLQIEILLRLLFNLEHTKLASMHLSHHDHLLHNNIKKNVAFRI
jgi:hypothetical protein